MTNAPSPLERGRYLPLLLSCLLWSAACGSGSDEESQALPREEGTTAPAEAAGDSADAGSKAQPVRPGAGRNAQQPANAGQGAQSTANRYFSNRSTIPGIGAWYGELRKRFDPSKDGPGWWTEVMAEAATRVLRSAFEEGIRGGGMAALEGAVGKDFLGFSELRPSAPVVLRDDGRVRVLRSAEGANSSSQPLLPREQFKGGLQDLIRPLVGAQDSHVEVHITSARQMPERSFELIGTVRISGRVGASGLQINNTWRMLWRIPQGGRRIVLMQLNAEAFEEVRFMRAPFAELTRYILREDPYYANGLMIAAPELARRVDRTIDFAEIYLGMHGMAIGDLDRDGLEDVYVAEPGGVPNRLLKHLPDGRVRDIAPALGVDFLDDCAGVVIVDIDGDGARDLLLGRGPAVAIVFGDGKGSFGERKRLACPGGEGVYSMAVADADGDGDLDIYATRYVKGGVIGGVPTPYHDAQNGASNVYFRNEGQRSFKDATAEVGFDMNNDRFSLAALWEDLDGDGDLDLYVTNDFGRNSHYRNDGGQFTDIASAAGTSDMAAGMGISTADIDLDGDLDMYISNMFTAAGGRVTMQPAFMRNADLGVRASYEHHTKGNTLLRNDGGGRFVDISTAAGVGPGGWSWGSVFADLDNDGLADLCVPNGFVTTAKKRDLESFFWRCVVGASPAGRKATREYQNAWVGVSIMSQEEGLSWNGRERNYAYLNLGEGRFADISGASGLDYRDDSRVICPVDWDGDGALDLWQRNRTAPGLRFLHNRAGVGTHWISFDLQGLAPNPDAIGAVVEFGVGERRTRRRLYAGEGYLSSPTRRLHFGLGDAAQVTSAVVIWPDGERSELGELDAGKIYRVTRGAQATETAVQALDTRSEADLMSHNEDRVPERIGAQRTRIPLLDRLSMRNLDLPRYEGAAARVRDYAGQPLLVILWANDDAEGKQELLELALERSALDAAGVALHPLTFDGPRELKAARTWLAGHGLPETGGALGTRLKSAIELILLEILGNYMDLPLPVGLLFDSRGQVVCVYLGELDAQVIAQDARDSEQGLVRDPRRTCELTGGSWLFQGPNRRLGQMLQVFRRAGWLEIAAELEESIKAQEK